VGEIPEVLASSGGGVLAPREGDGDLAPAIAAALDRDWDRAALRSWALRRRWTDVGEAVSEQLRGATRDHAARRGRAGAATVAPGVAR